MEDNRINISDIIQALKVIKEECTQHCGCQDCPFFRNDVCKIKYSDPEKWEIESHYIWRALK